MTTLPAGLSLRHPTWDDLEAVTTLVIAHDLAELGYPDYEIEDLRAEWEHPGFDLAADAWLVTAADGQIVGYVSIHQTEGDHEVLFRADGFVHPAQWGRGIGTALLTLAEQYARARLPYLPPGVPVRLRTIANHANPRSRELAELLGFTVERYYYRMEITMTAPPPAPQWADGLTARTLILGQDERPVFEALEEAFRDHWGFMGWDYDAWHRNTLGRSDFDPSLCYVVQAGEEIVAATLNLTFGDQGWIRTLGVRRPWRRSGVGLALLHQSFGEYYRRGVRTVALGVDAGNPTGATRLYEKAGMRPVLQFDFYQKMLRQEGGG